MIGIVILSSWFLISLFYYLPYYKIHCLTNDYTDVQYPANFAFTYFTISSFNTFRILLVHAIIYKILIRLKFFVFFLCTTVKSKKIVRPPYVCLHSSGICIFLGQVWKRIIVQKFVCDTIKNCAFKCVLTHLAKNA